MVIFQFAMLVCQRVCCMQGIISTEMIPDMCPDIHQTLTMVDVGPQFLVEDLQAGHEHVRPMLSYLILMFAGKVNCWLNRHGDFYIIIMNMSLLKKIETVIHHYFRRVLWFYLFGLAIHCYTISDHRKAFGFWGNPWEWLSASPCGIMKTAHFISFCKQIHIYIYTCNHIYMYMYVSIHNTMYVCIYIYVGYAYILYVDCLHRKHFQPCTHPTGPLAAQVPPNGKAWSRWKWQWWSISMAIYWTVSGGICGIYIYND